MEFKKNDIVTVHIDDMSSEGEGIGKADGYTLFVKNGVIGDTAEVIITKTKKTYGYARVKTVLEPSPYRVEPKCPIAGPCGGCQLQNMSYEEQLEFKRRKVENHMRRIAHLEDVEVLPTIGMEEPWRYRNKAQVPISRDKNGRIVAGFYAGRTHSVIAQEDCLLSPKINKDILCTVTSFMEEFGVEPYDEETGKGLVRHVLIRSGKKTGEIMVCLIVNGRKMPHSDVLVDRLTKIPGVCSISLNVNTERTNVILGREMISLYGNLYITDYIGDVSFQISPQSFFQVNPEQTEKLYRTALDYAGLTGKETVWDLYCGIGTISLFLAQKAGKVYGVEIVPQAIEDAKANALRNGFTNAEFYVGKAEEVLPHLYETQNVKADVIVVDPPRKGCDQALLDTILKMAPERVVYVSCDSATLARDLVVLAEQYQVEKVQPVDQFGMTVHVETVVLLSKGKVDSKRVKVEFSLEEMDMSEFQNGATYEQIKEYVLCKTGLKVSSLYISQVKRKCGLEVGKNYNMAKSEDAKQPQCPPEKEQAIMEAFKHFGMI